ncbi:MAG: 3-hydroxyacyl-CoA dehydrogenase NAD-binding domain-containing protein [Rickettsiales bacterium]|nr:3-hydroxyacyl-CoA dehydrogenase NAD-binding domain-containing protein [Rickettsiales bacterium]
MTEIKKAAVLGSGVMGSGIAAHLASAGVEVLLLDIVPKEGDRNSLATSAIEKLKKAKPALITHPKKLKNITPGNLDDDLEKLRDCDWIIEVVLERLDIKHQVYQKIAPYRRADAIVSSNTSTIPLHSLVEPMDEGFKKHFMVTHFFNPVRYMRLLEIVQGTDTDAAAVARIKKFAHENLGKGYVFCHDTPGFIANRIGVFWLTLGLLEAMEQGVSVEVADAVMSRPVGIPKTGVFGLFDLIGIDLMPLIAKELKDALPDSDAFCQLYKAPELVTKMIEDGYTGRKGLGGFYRLNKQDGKRVKESIDLKTGEYATSVKPKLASVNAAKGGLRNLVEHEDEGGAYARAVLMPMLHYSASLLGEIADDIPAIDRAMRWGYNWKYGPFELIDKLGTEFFAQWCADNNMSVPAIIEKAAGRPLYEGDAALGLDGEYKGIPKPAGVLLLSDATRGKTPVKKNGSCQLWDIGDGVLQLDYTSKMNSMDPDILSMMQQSVDIVKDGFKGLVIGGGEGTNFSVGANLGFFLFAANTASWSLLSDVVRQGQDAVMGLKHAPFPVVGAAHGFAFGGGCETLLHCDAVQAHVETYTGLVEVGVGVIPGWGGCKELLFRAFNSEKKGIFGGAMPATKTVFETIALAKVSESAELAKDLNILNEKSRITMNRDRLLFDAKNLVLELAEGYTPPEAATIKLAGKSGRIALDMAVKGMAALGKVTPHDQTVVGYLTHVVTGGDYDSTRELTEQDLLDLEHEHFMQLVKLKPTLDRIEHMLENNKPLRN